MSSGRAPPPTGDVATWTSQTGREPPRCYSSTVAWKSQMRLPLTLAVDRWGSVLRGRTLTAEAAASGHASLEPTAGAPYCTDCGVLVVHEVRHRQSATHLARQPHPDAPASAAALVLARLRQDTELAAALEFPTAGLTPPAAGLEPSATQVSAVLAEVAAATRSPAPMEVIQDEVPTGDLLDCSEVDFCFL